MLANGKPQSKVCVATAGETGIPSNDIEVMQDAMNTMREMAESIPFAQNSNFNEMDLDEMGGVPIIYVDLASNHRNEVESISTDKLEPITIPDGFRKQSMDDLLRR